MATKRFIAKNGLDNNSLTITNVANPTNAQDASTKAYTDLKAPIASPTFTGTVIVNNIKSATPGSIGQYDASYGSASTWYNAGFRNDGTSVYFLSSAVQTTEALAKVASWNTNRPFSWSLSTGAVQLVGNNEILAIGNGTSSVYKDASGNVGIGLTNGTSKLSIKGTTATDAPTLGTEFITGGTWTSTGWTGDNTTGWVNGASNATALSYSVTPTVSTKYQIAYTVTGYSAGSFTIAFGGQSLAGITATGTFGPTATTTGNLVITPTATFVGTIVVSIKAITAISTALITALDSTGTARFEVRASSAGNNTFLGLSVGRYNTTGVSNSAVGVSALQNNTTGNYNSAVGLNALFSNTTGNSNSTVGVSALQNNTTGSQNSAVGVSALQNNTTASNNSAVGQGSLFSNTTGSSNAAVGQGSLFSNTTGSSNIALGFSAGRYIADGVTALTVVNNSTYLGATTKASADNVTNETVIGYNATGSGSNTVTLGGSAVTSTVIPYGNVGIGTSSPTSKFHVRSDANALTVIEQIQNRNAGASAGGVIAFINSANDLADNRYAYIGAVTSGAAENGNNLVFATNSNGGTPAERMRIDSSGNVGIGTTSPSSWYGVPTLLVATKSQNTDTAIGVGNATSGPAAAASLKIIGGTAYSYSNSSLVDNNASPYHINEMGSAVLYRKWTFGGTERMRIDWTGNVGIGTSSPSGKLGIVTTASTAAWQIVANTTGVSNQTGIYADASNNMQFAARDGSGVLRVVIDSNSSTNSYINSGNVGIGTASPSYKLQVAGSFAATTKSFVIDHPTKEGMKLRYGSLEGPENGIYIRGRLNGNNIIELPEYWTKLIDEDSITVNLTPIGKHQKLYVADIVDNTVIIGNDNLLQKEINCFYTVFAERIDVEKLIVEIE